MKRIITFFLFSIMLFSSRIVCAQVGSLEGTVIESSDPATFDDSFKDWIIWQSVSTSVKKKDAGSLFSSLTVLGDQTVTNYSDSPRKITWENGDPISTATANSTGIYIPLEGSGFEFSVPAGKAESTLTLYFGGWAFSGGLTATLSDGSAPEFVDVTPEYIEDAAVVYTLKYKAASDNQHLTISWKVVKNLSIEWGGNISMQGATYETAGTGNEVLIQKITLEGGSITTDNGTLQLNATVEPANATNKNLRWFIKEGTDLALLTSTGLLSAISNGLVKLTVESRDGTFIGATTQVPISGQVVDKNDIFSKMNSISNWDFSTDLAGWDGWADESVPDQISPVSSDGICEMKVGLASDGQNYHYQFNQQPLTCEAGVPYTLKFKSWATAENTPCAVDFEDTELNLWNRYGSSSDAEAQNGRSEWHYNVSTTPTWYTFNVVFDQMVEGTVQKMNWMLSLSNETIYLDSVLLIKSANLALPAPKLISNSMKVYPNPVNKGNELTVSLATPNLNVSIYNSTGQKLIEKRAKGNMIRFNISNYRKGIYFVRSDDGFSQKIIVN